MRRSLMALGATVLLSSCTQAVENNESGISEARPEAEVRALRQLEARLGGPATLRTLFHGTEGGKPLLCGEAVVEGRTTPFAMRNGFLILPEDMTPESFAELRGNCTAPGSA